ncbi:MAG: 23S rRNA (pseudouridine(1915)-N(3))-methyltransferase RlmH [Acholeplasmataceae bacterium]|nr:23S rRNA (pseudouridine(1915)-N(3))-methyltransferase RlmH [Acholeplasmataceae bacterium]
MTITIISVGKMKQNTYQKEMESYLKQLPYPLQFTEINDEPTKEGIVKEGKAIIKRIPKNSNVIAMAIEGKMMDSVEFSAYLNELVLMPNKDICFIIGGSYGLSDEVISFATDKISFSKMTFPHQLFKLMLVEQIYRAFKIRENHPYHK